MSRSNRDGLPGRAFLNLVRRVFPAQELPSIFCAALADFHSELRDAGPHRLQQLAVRCRWYAALCVLLVVAPLTVPVSPVTGAVSVHARSRNGEVLVGLSSLALFAAMWSLWGWFVLGAITAGLALAGVMRSWYNRHPSTAAAQRGFSSGRLPEINLSSIPVPGDIAGLMFAAGSVVVVVFGLPGLRWLFVSMVVAGVLVAWGLFTWRGHAPVASCHRNVINLR